MEAACAGFHARLDPMIGRLIAGKTVAAGPTVFDFRNDGEELHELFIIQLVDGIDPHTAIESTIAQLEAGGQHTESPPEVTRRLGVARGGPHAIATLDAFLTPGSYIAICFLPDAQGVAHARHGMAHGSR